MVRKFSQVTKVKGMPFKGKALEAILQDCIDNTDLRTIDHDNPHKRKEVPIFHGFRKFFTKQLIDSKVEMVHVELLHGHDIGLTGKYYRPTEQDLYNEYLKAVNLLTIDPANRLRLELKQKIQIERTQLEALRADFDKFKQDILKKRK